VQVTLAVKRDHGVPRYQFMHSGMLSPQAQLDLDSLVEAVWDTPELTPHQIFDATLAVCYKGADRAAVKTR